VRRGRSRNVTYRGESEVGTEAQSSWTEGRIIEVVSVGHTQGILAPGLGEPKQKSR